MPGKSKLTPIEEMAVYEMKKKNVTNVEIAYKFGIDTSTVYRIFKRIEKKIIEGQSNFNDEGD